MEYIYIAKSAAHPGMVKIGRTDQPVDERMQQLSAEDYGPEGFSGNADWEAVTVIKVDDNVEAEALIHDHFSSERVTDSRELFYCEDIKGLSAEAIRVSQGTEVSLVNDPGLADFLIAGTVDTDDELLTLGFLFGIAGYAWYKIAPSSFNDYVNQVTSSASGTTAVTSPLKVKPYVGSNDSVIAKTPEKAASAQIWRDFKSASQAASELSKTKSCTVRIIRSPEGWRLQAT